MERNIHLYIVEGLTPGCRRPRHKGLGQKNLEGEVSLTKIAIEGSLKADHQVELLNVNIYEYMAYVIASNIIQ